MNSVSAAPATVTNAEASTNQWLVIGASSLGTVFEWYDFYLYGLLASILTTQFFSGVNETTGFIFALAAFAAGFAVRPFGALVFGRLGDLVGRKHTFLITMSIMGGATFAVGVLPNYASIGVTAPIALLALRLLQIWGGGHLCGRACAAGQARVLYELDSDHGHLRAVRGTARGDRNANVDGRGRFQGVGMAHSLHRVRGAVGGVFVDTHAVG
jgi:MFS family permease